MSEKNEVKTANSSISWEGQEYVSQDKNAGWYFGLVLVGILLVALSIFLQWWTFTALIVISVIALFVYTLRPPRMIKYTVNSKGLKEGEREYKFEEYKSFGVSNEDGHYAIVLIPRKRLAPRVRAYFPSEKGEAIVDAFGARLPMSEIKMDALDKVVKFLRI